MEKNIIGSNEAALIVLFGTSYGVSRPYLDLYCRPPLLYNQACFSKLTIKMMRHQGINVVEDLLQKVCKSYFKLRKCNCIKTSGVICRCLSFLGDATLIIRSPLVAPCLNECILLFIVADSEQSHFILRAIWQEALYMKSILLFYPAPALAFNTRVIL